MSTDLPLPRPHFVDRDPFTVTRESIGSYETMAGKALHPAQPERLMVDMVAYRETLTRIALQQAGA